MGRTATKKAGRGKRKKIETSDAPRVVTINAALLRRWPLPEPDEGGDKEERGRVLVVGGSREMPGAVVLAATAALRAGAGKLQIATVRSAAQTVAVAVPEARVFALPETDGGGLAAESVAAIADYVAEARAVLIGPGMCDEGATAHFTRALLPHITRATLVLDADALNVLANEPDLLKRLVGRAILTPHATEASEITGRDEDSIKSDPAGAAQAAARRFGCVVALKGRETFVAAPDPRDIFRNTAGNVGLATSGSGDTLAGLIAGLAARGAAPQQAAAWGVHVHALAGERLARSVGALGYLARELIEEFPRVLASLSRRQ